MMCVMSMNSLHSEFASSVQSEDFGRKRRNRYVLRVSSVSLLVAGVLFWSGAGATGLGEPAPDTAAPIVMAAIVDTPAQPTAAIADAVDAVAHVAQAPATWSAPRNRLEQLVSEQAEGAVRSSAPTMKVAASAPAPAVSRVSVIKSPTPERAQPVSTAAMLTLANIQPAVQRRPTPSSGYATPSADPNLFGSTAMSIGRTPMDAKWRSVSRTSVTGAAGGEILSAARGEGDLAQLQRVNVWINRRITFTDDASSGSADRWSNADESLRRGAGDCEDYAIAKLQVLRSLGVDERDLYLVLVKDLVRRADHAILVVRIDGRFLVLDSNTDRIISADQIQDYRPMMSFSGDKSWIHGYREQQPRVILASNSETEAGL